MNQVPEKLINFRVYKDSKDLVGIADVTLPSVEFLSETIKGAGIAGEINSPTLGHTGPLALSLSFRSITSDYAKLANQESQVLDIRGAQQVFDAGKNLNVVVPVRLSVRAKPTKIELGKFGTAASVENKAEFECTYMSLYVDGKEVLTIDKFNYICKVGGTDILGSVRKALGMT